MTDLKAIADSAVSLRKHEKISAADAVARAVEGHGLNHEQVHRVSTMVNRELLRHSKASSGPMGFPERWETSKPDSLVKKSSPTPQPDHPNQDVGSPAHPGSKDTDMDASLDYQLSHLKEMRQSLQGQHAGGSMTDGEGGRKDPVRPDLRSERPRTATPPTEKETKEMMPKGSSADLEWRARRLRAALGVPEQDPEPRRKVSGTEEAVARVRELHAQYFSAIPRMDGLITDSRLKLSEAQQVLLSSIDELTNGGFTLGEAMHVVKLAFTLARPEKDTSGYYTDIYANAMLRHGIDPQAAVGELRDRDGNLKTSEIDRARMHLVVRGQVANAKLSNMEHPVVKSSALFLDAVEGLTTAMLAGEILKHRASEASQKLAQVVEA